MGESKEIALRALDNFEQDIILKPLYGSRGKGVIRITNEKDAISIFNSLEENNEIYYIQQFFDHNNEDFRLFMIGDRIISAMKRKSSSWKTNIAQGGQALMYNPPQEYISLAIEAAKSVKGEIIGIDLMETKIGPQIIEVNAVPGYEGLQTVTSFDITEKIVDYVIQRGKR
jgi:ribosomal protein S6--L-glutamate ligase/tetrahydromethanopterin:alpha-L-glutamate ligase